MLCLICDSRAPANWNRRRFITKLEIKMRFNFATFLALVVCSLGVVVRGFDWSTGNSSVWLSAAAYCETNTYLTRTFKGPSAGFVATNVIDDKSKDVQVLYSVVLPCA